MQLDGQVDAIPQLRMAMAMPLNRSHWRSACIVPLQLKSL